MGMKGHMDIAGKHYLCLAISSDLKARTLFKVEHEHPPSDSNPSSPGKQENSGQFVICSRSSALRSIVCSFPKSQHWLGLLIARRSPPVHDSLLPQHEVERDTHTHTETRR